MPRRVLLAIPVLMLAFGVGMVWFCRWLARGEEEFLVAFLGGVIGCGEEAESYR